MLRKLRERKLVEDELESFFHLILYFSVRYLPNNFRNYVGEFVHKYFDDFTEHNGEYYVGDFKRSAIKIGIIETVPKGKLTFFNPPAPPSDDSAESTSSFSESAVGATIHPIDAILNKLLRSFSAYYTLCDASSTAARHKQPAPKEVTTLPQPPPSDDLYRMYKEIFLRKQTTSGSSVEQARNKQRNKGPSEAQLLRERAELVELAANIQSHERFLAILGQHVVRWEYWPAGDKLPDQLLSPRSRYEYDEQSLYSTSTSSTHFHTVSDTRTPFETRAGPGTGSGSSRHILANEHARLGSKRFASDDDEHDESPKRHKNNAGGRTRMTRTHSDREG